jgi:hypothetical protein
LKLLFILLISTSVLAANNRCPELYNWLEDINTLQLGLRTSQSQPLDAPANETVQDLLNSQEKIMTMRKYLANDLKPALDGLQLCEDDIKQNAEMMTDFPGAINPTVPFTAEQKIACLEMYGGENTRFMMGLLNPNCQEQSFKAGVCFDSIKKYSSESTVANYGMERLRQVDFALNLIYKKKEFDELHKLKKHVAATYLIDCQSHLKYSEVKKDVMCEQVFESFDEQEYQNLGKDAMAVALFTMYKDAQLSSKQIIKTCNKIKAAEDEYVTKYNVNSNLQPKVCFKCPSGYEANRLGKCLKMCKEGWSREDKDPYRLCVQDEVVVEKNKAKSYQNNNNGSRKKKVRNGNRSNKGLKIALISIAAIGVGVGGYYTYQHFANKNSGNTYVDPKVRSDARRSTNPTYRGTRYTNRSYSNDVYENLYARRILAGERTVEADWDSPYKQALRQDARRSTSSDDNEVYIVPPMYYGYGYGTSPYWNTSMYPPYLGNMHTSSWGNNWMYQDPSMGYYQNIYPFSY